MELIKNPYAIHDEQGESELTPLSFEIYSYIEKNQRARANDSNVLRGSAATLCVRRRWYQGKGYAGTPLAPRKIINFAQGDITEKNLAYYVKEGCVGPGKTYKRVTFGKVLGETEISGRIIPVYGQLESVFRVAPGKEVLCHFDGIGQRHDDSYDLLEFKSASNYGFQKFVKNEPLDYLNQAHAYMMTEMCKHFNVKKVNFVFLRKETSHIFSREYDYDHEIAKQVTIDYLLSIARDIPLRPYGPDSKGKLPWQCSYCPYVTKCWDAKKVYRNNKPQYYVDLPTGELNNLDHLY